MTVSGTHVARGARVRWRVAARLFGVPPCGTSPAVVPAREVVLRRAHALLLAHVAGANGLCVGCADLARFATAPCPMARRALSAIETHGVAVWDSPVPPEPPVDWCGTSDVAGDASQGVDRDGDSAGPHGLGS